jgi:hypothetical protein
MSATSHTRKSSRVPGAKVLITASALAATLAGWASLAWKASTDSAATSPSLLSAEAQLAAAGVSLQPIPTLVPGPLQLSVAANPAPAQAGSQPTLRSASALPAPVTLTQSSRP